MKFYLYRHHHFLHSDKEIEKKEIYSQVILILKRPQRRRKRRKTRKSEAKRQEAQQRKKAKQEKEAQNKLLKEQKSNHMICSCYSACATNHKCPCTLGKRSCTEYCGCHLHCKNPYNTKSTTPQPSSSDDVAACCVKRCGKSMKGQLIVECEDCHSRCHKTTCAMPSQRTMKSCDCVCM